MRIRRWLLVIPTLPTLAAFAGPASAQVSSYTREAGARPPTIAQNSQPERRRLDASGKARSSSRPLANFPGRGQADARYRAASSMMRASVASTRSGA